MLKKISALIFGAILAFALTLVGVGSAYATSTFNVAEWSVKCGPNGTATLKVEKPTFDFNPENDIASFSALVGGKSVSLPYTGNIPLSEKTVSVVLKADAPDDQPKMTFGTDGVFGPGWVSNPAENEKSRHLINKFTVELPKSCGETTPPTPEKKVVTPLTTVVTEAQCVDGEVTKPTITTKPVEGISYEVNGNLVQGGQVVVTASLDDKGKNTILGAGNFSINGNKITSSWVHEFKRVVCETTPPPVTETPTPMPTEEPTTPPVPVESSSAPPVKATEPVKSEEPTKSAVVPLVKPEKPSKAPRVVAPTTSSSEVPVASEELAHTGVDMTGPFWVGGVLLVVGAGFAVWAATRKRAH